MSIQHKPLHVAVGVIKDNHGQVLIAKRPDHVHQAGLWEFPGGKVEEGEPINQALQRELHEELGIKVIHSTPLIKIRHDYPQVSVLLDVWLIDRFSGIVYGCEGQAIRWVEIQNLSAYSFPAANVPIINALRLPSFYAILDDEKPELLLTNLSKILANKVKLIQARLKNLPAATVTEFILQAMPLCQQHQAEILINSSVINASEIQANGLHLTSADLMQLNQRPNRHGWVAASCHNLVQLQHAEKIGLDFVVLAPVLATKSHPDAQTLGWQQFSELVSDVNLPVFGLGGLTIADKEQACYSGAQGIAGIRMFL